MRDDSVFNIGLRDFLCIVRVLQVLLPCDGNGRVIIALSHDSVRSTGRVRLDTTWRPRLYREAIGDLVHGGLN